MSKNEKKNQTFIKIEIYSQRSIYQTVCVFNQDSAISSLNHKPLEIRPDYMPRSNISSTKRDIDISIGKAWKGIDLLIIGKADQLE